MSDAQYEVVRGINWTPPKAKSEARAEPGDTVGEGDFSKGDLAGLKKQGAIRRTKGGAK